MPPLSRSSVVLRCTNCEHRTHRMFCNLSEDALADFDSIGMQMMLPKGAILFREHDAGDGVLVKIAVPGDVLGLGAVISSSRFEVTAETIEPVQVKKIRRDDVIAFFERHGEASMHAAKALSEEYKSAFVDARRLALSGSAAARLAGVLLDWGRAAACGKPEMRFTMALTHEDLASLAGTSRETVTRTLGKFKKEKLIQIRGSSLHILSPDRLAQMSA
jgi:CRP/FNR family cyclic AMP-dependent transcriptional regulator